MCYNVLCDKYATRQMYGYCPSWALDWEYRKKGILEEIRHYAADIISLQVGPLPLKMSMLCFSHSLIPFLCEPTCDQCTPRKLQKGEAKKKKIGLEFRDENVISGNKLGLVVCDVWSTQEMKRSC